MKFTLVLCTEPYKHQALDTLLNLAEAILKKGHEIRGIFLFGSGVYALRRDVNAGKDVRNLAERLERFSRDNSVPVVGCSTWVALSGIKPDEFLEGASEEGLGELSTWAAESDRLVVFGSGV
ncbi:MAG: hypothetical protein Kow0069_16850 [Promethearchaeota archaeon]